MANSEYSEYGSWSSNVEHCRTHTAHANWVQLGPSFPHALIDLGSSRELGHMEPRQLDDLTTTWRLDDDLTTTWVEVWWSLSDWFRLSTMMSPQRLLSCITSCIISDLLFGQETHSMRSHRHGRDGKVRLFATAKTFRMHWPLHCRRPGKVQILWAKRMCIPDLISSVCVCGTSEQM